MSFHRTLYGFVVYQRRLELLVVGEGLATTSYTEIFIVMRFITI